MNEPKLKENLSTYEKRHYLVFSFLPQRIKYLCLQNQTKEEILKDPQIQEILKEYEDAKDLFRQFHRSLVYCWAYNQDFNFPELIKKYESLPLEVWCEDDHKIKPEQKWALDSLNDFLGKEKAGEFADALYNFNPVKGLPSIEGLGMVCYGYIGKDRWGMGRRERVLNYLKYLDKTFKLYQEVYEESFLDESF